MSFISRDCWNKRAFNLFVGIDPPPAIAWNSGDIVYNADDLPSIDTNALTVEGARRFLLVFALCVSGTPQDVQSVVYDPDGSNQAFTLLSTQLDLPPFYRGSLWGLVAPDVATDKIVRVTWDAVVSNRLVIADSYVGVDQTSPVFDLTEAIVPTDTTPSLAVDSNAGDLVVGSYAYFSGAADAPIVTLASGTLREKVDGATFDPFIAMAQGDQPGEASSTIVDWSIATPSGNPTSMLFSTCLRQAAA